MVDYEIVELINGKCYFGYRPIVNEDGTSQLKNPLHFTYSTSFPANNFNDLTRESALRSILEEHERCGSDLMIDAQFNRNHIIAIYRVQTAINRLKEIDKEYRDTSS